MKYLAILLLCISGCSFQMQTINRGPKAPDDMHYELKVFSNDGKLLTTEYSDNKPYSRFNCIVWTDRQTGEEEEFHLGSGDNHFGYSIKLINKGE